MYNNIKKLKHPLTIAISIAISIILAQTSSFFTNCTQINTQVFRLHILANSNSDYDQNLKLLVRDKILQLDNTLFSTKEISPTILEYIKKEATDVLLEQGCSLPVNVEVTNMYFTTRFYENYTLPAGNYDALRITIGDAVGDNWWCVLYPPLCIPAVTSDGVDDVLSEKQVEIIANGEQYQFKFALFELYSRLKN